MLLALSFRGTSAHTGDVGIRFPQLFQLENTDCHVASLLEMTGLFVACSIFFEVDDQPNTSSNKDPRAPSLRRTPRRLFLFVLFTLHYSFFSFPSARREKRGMRRDSVTLLRKTIVSGIFHQEPRGFESILIWI